MQLLGHGQLVVQVPSRLKWRRHGNVGRLQAITLPISDLLWTCVGHLHAHERALLGDFIADSLAAAAKGYRSHVQEGNVSRAAALMEAQSARHSKAEKEPPCKALQLAKSCC